MMTIVLNGSNQQVDDGISINQLLESLGLSEKRLAVEINRQIVPRSDFSSHTLTEMDHVEIVQAIGGGQPVKPWEDIQLPDDATNTAKIE